MDWNEIEGDWKRYKGNIREQWGNLTDEELDEIDGNRLNRAGFAGGHFV